MTQLIYTLERARGELAAGARRSLADDATLGVIMAGLGLGINPCRIVAAEPLQLLLGFADDTAVQRFNLRIERALAVRGVRIVKIHADGESTVRDEARAAA